jgi:hypothetical protein
MGSHQDLVAGGYEDDMVIITVTERLSHRKLAGHCPTMRWLH